MALVSYIYQLLPFCKYGPNRIILLFLEKGLLLSEKASSEHKQENSQEEIQIVETGKTKKSCIEEYKIVKKINQLSANNLN